MTTKEKLVSAVTQFDAKHLARTKGDRAKGYNWHALPQYLARVEEICADMETGADARKAICAGFHGPIASACLRSLGLPAWSKADQAGGLFYVPASR